MADIGQVEKTKIPTKIFADQPTDSFFRPEMHEIKIFVIAALLSSKTF